MVDLLLNGGGGTAGAGAEVYEDVVGDAGAEETLEGLRDEGCGRVGLDYGGFPCPIMFLASAICQMRK